jgi:hypothetical protein
MPSDRAAWACRTSKVRSPAAVLGEHVEDASRAGPAPDRLQRLSGTRGDPALVLLVDGNLSWEGSEQRRRTPSLGHADELSARGSVQILRQVLLELANADISHADMLGP